jgi:EpsI family protein
MTRRRDVLIGGACVAAAGTAYALTPRHRVSLLGTDKLDDIVPRSFGDWTSVDMNDEVAPREEGSLASKLYGQTVGRVYTNAKTGAEVMMLLAWGDTQSNQLQVHRPEVCYAAFGYTLLQNEPYTLDMSHVVTVPARRLRVSKGNRQQDIVYWTRLGEALPDSLSLQRVERWRNAVRGLLPDGVLVRFSTPVTGETPSDSVPRLAAALVMAMPPRVRRVLVGTARSSRLPVTAA